MTLCGCIIQEGKIPESKIELLERGLTEISSRYFGTSADIAWTTVAPGNGWTAGEPSSTSLVVMYVPPGLDQAVRTTLLEAICDLWTGNTGCSISEIVATARDTVNWEYRTCLSIFARLKKVRYPQSPKV